MKLVIIGFGYAGALLYKKIVNEIKNINDNINNEHIEIIIVTKKDHVFLKMSCIRALVDNDYLNRSMIPLNDVVKYGTIIIADVIAIEQNVAKLSNDMNILYDYLVCATGTIYKSPLECDYLIDDDIHINDKIINHYQRVSNLIIISNDIVIIGGGLTSIELAGEIRQYYPDKKISIFCAASHLMMSNIASVSKKFHKILKNKLYKKNIHLYINARITEPSLEKLKENNYIIKTSNIKYEYLKRKRYILL